MALYGGRYNRRVRAGPIAGITIACVAFVVAVAFLFFCCLSMRRRRRRRNMIKAGPPAGGQYHTPYQGAPPRPRHGGLMGMLTSLLPGKREKGYYGGPPGMAESGYGPGRGSQQYSAQAQHPGYQYGGQPDRHFGDGGVAEHPGYQYGGQPGGHVGDGGAQYPGYQYGGQPDGYVGDGGVTQPPPSQPPPAYGSRP